MMPTYKVIVVSSQIWEETKLGQKFANGVVVDGIFDEPHHLLVVKYNTKDFLKYNPWEK